MGLVIDAVFAKMDSLKKGSFFLPSVLPDVFILSCRVYLFLLVFTCVYFCLLVFTAIVLPTPCFCTLLFDPPCAPSFLFLGKSVVVEQNHTLMLGWNDEAFGFIEEICLANESEGGGVIVVLSNHEKEDMDHQLNDRYLFTIYAHPVLPYLTLPYPTYSYPYPYQLLPY